MRPPSRRWHSPRRSTTSYGFPQELFATRYSAPGDPQLAAEVAEIAKPTWVGVDEDSWGIDHGAWSVLVHAFPDADIPVVQLSINAVKPFSYHLDLAARLAPLRDSGVLIMASGNVVHNLGRTNWEAPDSAYDWTRRFDERARGVMTTAPHDLGAWRRTTTSRWRRPRPTTSFRCSISPAWPPRRATRPTCWSRDTPWAHCR